MKKLLFFVSLLLVVFSFNHTVKAQEDSTTNSDTPYDAQACQKSCGSCKTTTNVCGRIQYDTCVDQEGNYSTDSSSFCKSSKYYRCYSKDNNNCASNYGFDLMCSECPNGKSGPSAKYETDTCQQSCGACSKVTTCGIHPTYDTCTDDKGQTSSQLCSNGAKKFGCYASANPMCQSGNLEYDCSACPAATEKLPVTDADGLRPLNLTAVTRCVNPTINSQELNVGWQQISSNVFYKVTLYNGGAVEIKCLDSNTFSYTFNGTFSPNANLRVALSVFSGAGCTGTLMKSAEITALGADCGNNTPPANYILDGLRIGTDKSILSLTGATKSVHLDGKEGTAQNFIINFEAYFAKTGQQRLYKALPIKFVYSPDGATAPDETPKNKEISTTKLTDLKTGKIAGFTTGGGYQGNMLYLVNSDTGGRGFFGIENYGIDYSPIKSFGSVSVTGSNNFIMMASNYNLYAAYNRNLAKFNFADLYHPSILKTISFGGATSIMPEFMAFYEKSGLLFVKLSDGNLISVKASDLTSGQDLNIPNIKNMVINNDLAFIVPSDSKTLDIYNISDLQTPQLVSKNPIHESLSGKDLVLKKDGDKLYIVAKGSNTIYVYKIIDQKSLSGEGHISASSNFNVFNGKLFIAKEYNDTNSAILKSIVEVYKINFENE